MSHHLDTPLAAQNGQLYIDDLYLFGSKDGTVFVMDVDSTVTGPDVQPGFHHEARYEFKVHFDGGEHEELTYRVSFGEPDSSGRQALRLHSLTGPEARDDSARGELLLERRTGESATGGGARIWAGRIADPFYADLAAVSPVSKAVKSGTAVDLSEWHPENAKNLFAGTTVEAIVLEISHQHPRLRPGAQVAVWCATKLATDAGGWRQINRGGYPMIWPLFRSEDTRFSDPANARHPSEDFAAEGRRIAERVAAVVAANGTADDPQGYGEIVARKLFPDILPYEVGTAGSFSFAAINGRPIADDAPGVMMSMVANMAVPSGFKPSVSKALRRADFPYVVPAPAPQLAGV
jgi:hypothetical protein